MGFVTSKRWVSPLKPSSAALATLALAWLACAACAPSLPAAFVAKRDAAERAYLQRDYAAAAAHWTRARDEAPNARERHEASYRLATTYERAGDAARAEALYLELERTGGERAARAAYARAALAAARGDEAQANRLLRAALIRFPDSGPARGALIRYLDDLGAAQGGSAALAEIDALLEALRRTELAETLDFERARRSEASVSKTRARAAYLAVADRYPYPFGAYWDDALLAAARIDLELGDDALAVAHLSRILAEHERARFSGSYERKTFAEARFRIAEIYRDRLRDPARARAEFRRVFVDHPTSLLRDDALFEESLILIAQGLGSAACEPAELLVRAEPDSRFAACAPILCPTLKGSSRTCRPYLLRKIEAVRARTSAP